MSARLLGLAWKVRLGPMPVPGSTAVIGAGVRKAVLMRLIDSADDDGRNIFPSVNTVARDTELSERSVRYVIRQLCDDRLLKVVEAGGGRRKTTEYALNLERLLAFIPVENTASGAPFDQTNSATHAPFDSGKGASHAGGTAETLQDLPETVQHVHPTPCYPLESVTPKGNTDSALDVHFNAFWLQYPRKASKGNARRTYAKIINSGKATVDDLEAGAMRYAAATEGTEQRYIKHPASWLAGECWLDETPSPANPDRFRRSGRQSATATLQHHFEGVEDDD